MKHTTTTAIAIDTAARASTGDFYAMRRECARFCTESLVDAATQSLEALTSSERAKFALADRVESEGLPPEVESYIPER